MEIKELAQFLKMLADESRLRMIHLLARQELSVTDLCAVLGMSQSSVSKHLVKLRLLGVVTDLREGSFMMYRLNEQNALYVKVIQFLLEHFGSLPTFQADAGRLAASSPGPDGAERPVPEG